MDLEELLIKYGNLGISSVLDILALSIKDEDTRNIIYEMSKDLKEALTFKMIEIAVKEIK